MRLYYIILYIYIIIHKTSSKENPCNTAGLKFAVKEYSTDGSRSARTTGPKCHWFFNMAVL